LVCADGVNILGGSVQTVKENAEALVVATKEIGLEVNADKTKEMAVFPDKNEGTSHNVKTDKSFFERVKEFKYLWKTLAKQNCIREEIKGRLQSRNACYHLVRNVLSYSLLFKNIKFKI
jgi:hypothetical protein